MIAEPVEPFAEAVSGVLDDRARSAAMVERAAEPVTARYSTGAVTPLVRAAALGADRDAT